MFPTIPEDLSVLGSAALRALRLEVLRACRAANTADATDEVKADITKHRAIAARLSEQADDAEQEEAAEARVAADDEAAAAQAAATAEAEAAAEAERLAADEAAAAAAAAETAAETTDETTDETTAAGVPAVVRTGVPATGADAGTGRVRPTVLARTDGSDSTFESYTQLAGALIERSRSIAPTTDVHHPVARIVGSYTEDELLSENPIDNLPKFARQSPEIMAAMCAPAEPQYDLACWNTDRRPVRASLNTFAAPRGAVTIYPSPTLEDIDTGVGVWTAADDANGSATKVPCATIECATPVEYRWYGIYKCITIKNMLAMTFPELMEAYLNRLAAAHARLAEITMLEAMANSADTLDAHELGYNATVAIGTNLLNYLALYQEQQRWDVPNMLAWMPRWVLYALKADMMRRRSTNGGRITVPSDDDVRRLFTEVGFTPYFFLDSPSWVTPIPDLQVTGRLGEFPANLEILVAPVGKFRAFDEGELRIGVTGNHIYRDNESNRRNQFTMFWENFEGVVDTNTCPAHLLQFNNLCFNGQQIDDIIIACQGQDEVGAAS